MDKVIINSRMFQLQGRLVILDFHLSECCNIELVRLRQILLNNIGLFSRRLIFKLTQEQYEFLGYCSLLPANTKLEKTPHRPFAITEKGLVALNIQLKNAESLKFRQRVCN